MSSKVVSLEFAPSLKVNEVSPEAFQEMVVRSMRGLFARDSARRKEIEKLLTRNMELEEIVFRMNSRIDRALGEETIREEKVAT